MRARPPSGPPFRTLVLALGLGVLRASSGTAQDPCRHCLDGFRFLPSSVVPDAFPNTRFVNSTGGGMAVDLMVPVRNLQGDVVDSLQGDIGFLLLDFEYQKSLARWLALRVGADAVGRVGTSVEAVVASGASAAFGGSFGATVPIWHTRQFLVSAVGDVRRTTAYEIDPYGFAQGVVDDGFNDNSKELLLGDVPINRWTVGLRGAWAIRPWVGLNASFESGLADSPEIDTGSLTALGAQVGFDFAKLYQVPIALSLAYRGLSRPRPHGGCQRQLPHLRARPLLHGWLAIHDRRGLLLVAHRPPRGVSGRPGCGSISDRDSNRFLGPTHCRAPEAIGLTRPAPGSWRRRSRRCAHAKQPRSLGLNPRSARSRRDAMDCGCARGANAGRHANAGPTFRWVARLTR